MNGSAGFLRKIGTKGPRGVCRAVADRVEEWVLEGYFEWRLGIATRGTVSREALGYGQADCSDYAPSAYGNIRRILQALDIHAGDDVFIDFGSGKGRVVIMAALHPFARVVGVERSPALNDVARRNLERARKRMQCHSVEVVTADAAVYDVPDDATIVYFASPFSGEILDAVLDNVKASLMRAPRELLVISHGYDAANPFERRIQQCDWLRVRCEVTLQRSNCAWIYANCRWNMRPAVSAV
jgi:16S rRNA G966 N2-methylase RsmD